MWKKRFSVHSLLLMMILISLLCMAPLIIMAGVVYSMSMKTFEDSIIKAKQAETASFSNLFNRDMDLIRIQMYNLLSDKTVNSLTVKYNTGMYDTNMARDIDSLKADLLTMQSCVPFLDEIYIHFRSVGKSLGVNNSLGIYDSGKYEIAATSDSENARLVFLDGQMILSAGNFVIYNKDNNQSTVAVTASITTSTMNRYLSSMSGSVGSSQYALYRKDGEGYDLFSPVSGQFGEMSNIDGYGLKAEGHRVVRLNDKEYLLTWAQMERGRLALCQLTLMDDIMPPLVEYRRNIVPLLLLAILLSLAFCGLLYRSVYRPVQHAQRTFKKMEQGDLGIRLGKTWTDEFQLMYNQFDSMSKRIQDQIEREYRFQILSSKAELKQLQYQISPHFLYNTYFILQSLLQMEEYEKAQLLSGMMGRYLKYITYSEGELSTLGEETRHAQDYVKIQQMRFSNLHVKYPDCPEDLQNIQVPRLCIQPILENAFEHGIKQRLDDAFIRVSFSVDGNRVFLNVEDNGTILTNEMLSVLQEELEKGWKGDGIALYNINRRLRILFDNKGELKLSRSELGGLCCTLIFQKEVMACIG